MTTYGTPLCLKCKKFKSAPKFIGGKAMCTAYANGIPKKIYFEAGKCGKFLDDGVKRVVDPRRAILKGKISKKLASRKKK